MNADDSRIASILAEAQERLDRDEDLLRLVDERVLRDLTADELRHDADPLPDDGDR